MGHLSVVCMWFREPQQYILSPFPSWSKPRTVPLCFMQVFKEEKYLREAVECGDLIWQRGLLHKGYGLCHGTAGNGYAFLALYRATGDQRHLYHACKVRTLNSGVWLFFLNMQKLIDWNHWLNRFVVLQNRFARMNGETEFKQPYHPPDDWYLVSWCPTKWGRCMVQSCCNKCCFCLIIPFWWTNFNSM